MATYLQQNSGIYKITNLISGKVYVGCASNIKRRMSGHKYDLRKEKHNNNYLQKAWNKYGEKSFTFEVIEKCEISNLHTKEHYWVIKLNCLDRQFGYNLNQLILTVVLIILKKQKKN